MPPKKGKKGGKKKKKGDDDGGALSAAQLAKAFEMQNTALKRQLADRSADATSAEKAKRELMERVETLQTDFKSERAATFDITADMTRQYKAMQEELLGKINELQNTVNDLKDELADARVTLEDTKREHERQLKEKDDMNESLKLKMNEMAEEFAEMLHDTLKKMGEKIDLTSNTWEGDSSIPVIRRVEDFNT